MLVRFCLFVMKRVGLPENHSGSVFSRGVAGYTTTHTALSSLHCLLTSLSYSYTQDSSTICKMLPNKRRFGCLQERSFPRPTVSNRPKRSGGAQLNIFTRWTDCACICRHKEVGLVWIITLGFAQLERKPIVALPSSNRPFRG